MNGVDRKADSGCFGSHTSKLSLKMETIRRFFDSSRVGKGVEKGSALGSLLRKKKTGKAWGHQR